MIKLRNHGFTLIELLVVASIIGILSSIVYANFGSSRAQARDAERKANLRNLQTAIEQYKLKKGRYPEAGCTMVLVLATEENCAGGYIKGLVPDFIDKLPRDNNRNGHEGYSYITNETGTVYKVMALHTAEIKQDYSTEASVQALDMKAYDLRNPQSSSFDREIIGWCAKLINSDNIEVDFIGNKFRPDYDKSYGVWGGFTAKGLQNDNIHRSTPNSNPSVVKDTTDVICQ